MQALNKCTEGEQNAEDSRDPVSSEAHWGCTQVTEQVVRSGWGVNIGDETAQACSEKCSDRVSLCRVPAVLKLSM